jgi:hypothetical protein
MRKYFRTQCQGRMIQERIVLQSFLFGVMLCNNNICMQNKKILLSNFTVISTIIKVKLRNTILEFGYFVFDNI